MIADTQTLDLAESTPRRLVPRPFYDADGITIYCGDAREIVPHLPQVDLILTDPPYAVSQKGVSHVGRPGRGTRKLDFFAGDDDWPAIVAMWRDVLGKSVARLRPHGSVYAWIGHRQFGPTVADLEELGFNTRFLVWVKECPAPPPPGAGWPSAAELCVYGWRDGRQWTHGGSNPPPANVFVADSFRHGQPGKLDHPTQKPMKIIAPLITASTLPGDTILDPFAGSGTTLETAKLLGRKAIGIEIEERYCEIIAGRLAQDVLQLEGPIAE